MSGSPASKGSSEDERIGAAGFSPIYRQYVISLLLIAYVFNFLDRQIVNILAEPIKRDLDLADWQIGLMGGLAFSILYSVIGLPIARLADRGNRPLIIAVAISIWSVFTVLCGLAQNFVQLVAARIGVGVGEAGCTPPAHSLIVDYAPPEKRSSALAIYGMGPAIGGLLGMSMGGLIADAYGWRVAFFIAGGPGLLIGLLIAITLKEPRRQIARDELAIKSQQSTLKSTLRHLAAMPTFWFLASGNSIKSLISMGKAVFIASFFLRSRGDQVDVAASRLSDFLGMSIGPIGFLGIILGLIFGVFGALGVWTGGYLSDRFGNADPRRYMYIAALAGILTVPTIVGALFIPSLGVGLTLLAGYAFFGGFSYAPTYTVAFSLVPSDMRATTSAIMLFLTNLIGLGLGPLIVGIISDLFSINYGEAEGLRYSLIAVSSIGIIAGILYILGSRTILRDLDRYGRNYNA